MKILLAPSETKQAGGTEAFQLDKLFLDELFKHREALLDRYVEVLERGDRTELSNMFGLKKDDDIKRYRKNPLKSPAMIAIKRYTGVAYDHLDYDSLDEHSKLYLHDNLLIFSNLFGVLRADDLIPDYRLQQGKQIDDIKPEQFYKPVLQHILDDYLDGEDILDIRAGFYDKYYKPSLPHTVLKFLKNGKVVSHWAKAYRGIVLREIARSRVDSLDDFIALPIKGLEILEIQTRKSRTEIIYEIKE